MKIILNILENIGKKGDVCTDFLNYFLIKDAKFARFYLLSEIHKRLSNVPGRSVPSNCGYHTEIFPHFWISIYSQLSKIVKSYKKDTHSILCSMDVVGLYPNNLHDEGFSAHRERLNERDKKM